MSIPKIIHQTWKTTEIPEKWAPFQKKVQMMYPDWEYILWTDDDNDNFVKKEFPSLYETFMRMPKNIMRADVIRYLIMHKMGGMYLDLDYEVLKPYDFSRSKLVLPKNRSKRFGDEVDEIGNCIFASVPKHQFWADVIEEIKSNPPQTNDHTEVMDSTGPKFISKVFFANSYKDAEVPERMIFHPPLPKNQSDYEAILTNNISYGIHHCWGSWIERLSWNHLKHVFKKSSLYKEYVELNLW